MNEDKKTNGFFTLRSLTTGEYYPWIYYKQIGSGTYAEILQFYSPSLAPLPGEREKGEDVVIKLSTEDGPSYSLIREASAIIRMWKENYPYAIRLLDVVTIGNKMGLVLPLADMNLRNYVRKHSLSLKEKTRLMYRIAKSVAYAQSQNILHGDYKPDNILMFGDEPVLADFGLTLFQQGLRVKRMSYFSIWWRSPELLLGGKYGFPSDIWALAAIFYFILTLRDPFRGNKENEQLALYFREFGIPTEASWPGLSWMPLADKVKEFTFSPSFTSFPRKDVKEGRKDEKEGRKEEKEGRKEEKEGRKEEKEGRKEEKEGRKKGVMEKIEVWPDAHSLIHRMFRLNPKDRPTIDQVLRDRFFKDIEDNDKEKIYPIDGGTALLDHQFPFPSCIPSVTDGIQEGAKEGKQEDTKGEIQKGAKEGKGNIVDIGLRFHEMAHQLGHISDYVLAQAIGIFQLVDIAGKNLDRIIFACLYLGAAILGHPFSPSCLSFLSLSSLSSDCLSEDRKDREKDSQEEEAEIYRVAQTWKFDLAHTSSYAILKIYLNLYPFDIFPLAYTLLQLSYLTNIARVMSPEGVALSTIKLACHLKNLPFHHLYKDCDSLLLLSFLRKSIYSLYPDGLDRVHQDKENKRLVLLERLEMKINEVIKILLP